jgi:2-dehydropantoate 2-reductase
MKILVVGAGAVGGYFGALLARAGHPVTFVARGDHGRAIAERGLVVNTPDGRLAVRVPVLAQLPDAAGVAADLAIVTVKAKDLGPVARDLGPALAPAGVAVPLLNGLDSEGILAEALGPGRVIGGVAQIASEITGPGELTVREHGRLMLAPLERDDLPRAEALATTLAAAGFACRAAPDLQHVLWSKLLWNAPFNAVCALTGLDAGRVLDVPDLEALVRAAMAEVIAVAQREGISLEEGIIEATLAGTRRRFARTVPSMLQDVRAGRPTEADALQGAVVSRGDRHGISVPIHRTLLGLLKGLEAGQIG